MLYILLDKFLFYRLNRALTKVLLLVLGEVLLESLRFNPPPFVKVMKDRVTFLVITSKTGAQRRFSLRKNVIYCIIIIAGFLLGSGIIGAWKYRENASLQKKNMLLEAEKGQLEAVARAVKDIQNEEKGIRKLLGLENGEADEGKNLEY